MDDTFFGRFNLYPTTFIYFLVFVCFLYLKTAFLVFFCLNDSFEIAICWVQTAGKNEMLSIRAINGTLVTRIPLILRIDKWMVDELGKFHPFRTLTRGKSFAGVLKFIKNHRNPDQTTQILHQFSENLFKNLLIRSINTWKFFPASNLSTRLNEQSIY